MVVALTSTKSQGHRQAKTSRIELRATEDDRDLLDRAAEALGTDRSSFLLAQGRLAACRGFYEQLIPEFERSPADPLHLLLLVKDIRRTLGPGSSCSS